MCNELNAQSGGGPPPFPTVQIPKPGTLHHGDIIHLGGVTTGIAPDEIVQCSAANYWYNGTHSHWNYSVGLPVTGSVTSGSFYDDSTVTMSAQGSYFFQAQYNMFMDQTSGAVNP